MERFDCLCREGGHGAGVNSQILVTGAGTDCSITCEDGFRISTISNFNVFKQLFDTVFNGGYVQTTFSNPTKFCTLDNSINIDLVDPSDSEAEQAGSQSGEQGGVSKGTISIKDPVTGKEEVVEIVKNKKENSISYRDPETGNQVEIKPKDKTGGNTITITDTITGEKKTVEIGKNDNKKNEISYKDPYTGKDVVIDLSPKDKIDDSQGEAKSQGKVDKKGEGDFEFKGPNLGALGNPNDFDEGGKALSAFEDLDKKSSGLIDSAESLYQDSLSTLTDFKSSIDSLKEKANELSDNPFSASIVSSCLLSFTLLDQTIDIDVCKYTSQFRNLIYFLIYIPLNLFIAFKLLSLLFLIVVNI
ncbi:hypothetical protein [Campylobacter sp.]|uniref:hypothetical protein n=1 Tax=Campylobacter sp. TaxID=205 RepID=UPI002AA90E7E|nr:hypothetical protein [Campylobacter sp.]MCI7076684.1 hypothetical protein [Campylobacter sp.]